ncbi:MAG: flagellar protein [Bdellovibrionaceae bacterium]|nr:flagellar protein [Pseudobdellovibrionaceae bacterium]|tara:strand:- start:2333 stop:2548 length:216 start_codon:yes stop_codon:yes gene_type:complete
MIQLSRINGKKFIVNCDLIQFVESTPDTVLTLTNGEKHIVSESIDDVIRLTIEFKSKVFEKPIRKEGPSWT